MAIKLERPVGAVTAVREANGASHIPGTSGFGITFEGIPFYNPTGVAEGERAELGLDEQGQPSLTEIT